MFKIFIVLDKTILNFFYLTQDVQSADEHLVKRFVYTVQTGKPIIGLSLKNVKKFVIAGI